MIKINRSKKAIQIGELVIVKEWKDKRGYVYSDRIGIVMGPLACSVGEWRLHWLFVQRDRSNTGGGR